MPYTVEADNYGSALEGKCLSLAVERGAGTPPGIFYHSTGDFHNRLAAVAAPGGRLRFPRGMCYKGACLVDRREMGEGGSGVRRVAAESTGGMLTGLGASQYGAISARNEGRQSAWNWNPEVRAFSRFSHRNA